MSEADAWTGQWLPAARAGSAEAIGAALQACRGYLLQVAQEELGADLRAKGGASDVVQQTLLDAVRDFGRFHGDTEAELLAWLRRLLLNNLTDLARQYRDAGKRQVAREVGLGPADSTAGPGLVLPASTGTPSREVVAREEEDAVRRAVDGLPDDYRRAIALRYQEGRSFEEIGAELGLSPNAARKLLVRAVERVRHALEGP
jgi:RNA polymerase sigma-70 factor (ECF subfamily)